MKKIFTILTFCICASIQVNAQTGTDEQLAAQYLQNKEYDKAEVLYEKLFNAKQEYIYYSPLLDCYINLKEYKKAEKLIKRLVKTKLGTPQYGVDLGYLYLKEGNESDAKSQFESLIKDMLKEQDYVIALANAFLLRDRNDEAIETYLKARKEMKDEYPFNIELAEIYSTQKDYDKMMDEYVSLIEYNSSYLEKIENTLQDIIADDVDDKKSTALKNVLLKRIQKDPENTFYAEMLLWYAEQKKDFETAFVQAKSLDRKNKEGGKRVYELAQTAVNNEAYDVAIEAYQFLIDKGKNNYYYSLSRVALPDVKYNKIINTGNYTKEDLVSLEKEYLAILDEEGRNEYTISLMKSLAHLQAFYLDKSGDAIKLLKVALAMTSAEPSQKAECKIELADIYLLTGEVWEATLLYSQVDKDFKDEPIGHLAKFKNAKLSFYIGEFEWAKAQLDILKAATSKLIANDAMQLSLLISDNIGADSSYEPLQYYALAELQHFRNRPDSALITLHILLKEFPGHSITDEVYFKMAEIWTEKKQTDSAIVYYKKIIDNYAYDILADDALFKLAEIYENKGDKETAMSLYDQLMKNYPGSTFVVEARKKYRKLRGDIVN